MDEAFNELKTALDALNAKLDQLNERQASFETKIQNEILDPANKAYEKSEKDKRFNDFKDKYGEKLSPYENDVKALEGDDFDIYSSTFDAIDGDDSVDADAFIESVTGALKEKIDSIKSKLGVPQDAEVEVTVDPNGDVEVKADGETVAESSEETSAEVTAEEPKADETEEPKEGEKPCEGSECEKGSEEEVADDYDGTTDEEELKKLMEELDNYKE